jgi:hypothetical protein
LFAGCGDDDLVENVIKIVADRNHTCELPEDGTACLSAGFVTPAAKQISEPSCLANLLEATLYDQLLCKSVAGQARR